MLINLRSSEPPGALFENMVLSGRESFKVCSPVLSTEHEIIFTLGQGFGPEENSWEPRENLECPELIKSFEDEVKMKKDQSKRKGIILLMSQ